MKNKIKILDGGMGRELERIGAPFEQPLWSAQALMESPESVTKAHMNFILAGADLITTNSYAVVPHHMGEDLYLQHHKDLLEVSGQAARNAVEQSMLDITIAGCVPPVFGSYRPDLFDANRVYDLLKPFFTLQRPYCDLWIAETVSSMEELRAIKAAYDSDGDGLDLWVALTLDELNPDHNVPLLRSGEVLSDVMPEIINDIRPKALLFNCCPIENILPAIRISKDAAADRFAIGAYANAFVNSPEPRKATITSCIRHNVTPKFYLDHAKEWAEAGATIIGGCCGIFPEHIQALRDYF